MKHSVRKNKKLISTRSVLTVAAVGAAAFFVPQAAVNVRFGNQIFKSVESVPAKEYAIIMGARVYENDRLSDAARERIEAGVRLYEAGKARKLFFSGDNRNNREAEAIAAYAVGRGVPASEIVIDPLGIDTKDTCRNFSRVGREAIIVSQGFHLPRTLYLCRQDDIAAVGLAVEHLGILASRGDNLPQIYRIRTYRTLKEAVLIWSYLLGVYDYFSDEAEKIQAENESRNT